MNASHYTKSYRTAFTSPEFDIMAGRLALIYSRCCYKLRNYCQSHLRHHSSRNATTRLRREHFHGVIKPPLYHFATKKHAPM
jgi:hypothetical protein